MKVYVNSNNEIKDVGTCNDANLMEVEISDEFNPFMGWSVAKICCHKVILRNGKFAGFTPYVDSRLIEHIERLGKENEVTAEDVANTQMGLMETYEMTETNTSEITNTQLALMELYEMIAEE